MSTVQRFSKPTWFLVSSTISNSQIYQTLWSTNAILIISRFITHSAQLYGFQWRMWGGQFQPPHSMRSSRDFHTHIGLCSILCKKFMSSEHTSEDWGLFLWLYDIFYPMSCYCGKCWQMLAFARIPPAAASWFPQANLKPAKPASAEVAVPKVAKLQLLC